ncbi:MAG: MMPL family transporter [Gammaproteobacteria bacterium]
MRHWRIAAFYLAPLLLALTVLTTVRFKTDLSAFIIAGDNADEILLANEIQSGSLSRRYLLSVAAPRDSTVPGDFLEDLRKRLAKIHGVVEVWSPAHQNDFTTAVAELYAPYGSRLYSLDAERTLAALFTPQGLKQRAAFLKRALLSPQGAVIKKIAVQDPLLLLLDGFRAVRDQLPHSGSRGNQFGNLVLETSIPAFDSARQEHLQNEIKITFDRLESLESAGLRLDMTGMAVFAVATQKLIQADIVRVSMLSAMGLIVLFLLIFRSFLCLLQVFNLLIISILGALLATQLFFGYVHGLTVAIGSTLMGICIDYPIHALAHTRTVANSKRSLVIARIWPSMVLGALTTLVGYAVLGLSGYPGFQQVAVYAGFGIILSLFLTRFVLPAFLGSDGARPVTLPMVAGWATFCFRFRPWLVVLVLGTFCMSLFGLNSLHWMADMQQLTPELDYLKEKDQEIRARMVSIEPGRFILVSGSRIENALQKAEEAYGILERLKQQGSLSDYFGLYPWLLSSRLQEHNQRLLQRYLTADNLRLWRQALREQGLSVERLGHFDYPLAEPLAPERVLTSDLKKLVDGRILTSEQQTLVTIWLATHSPEDLRMALDHRADIRYFSQRDLLNKLTRDYIARARILCGLGLAVIFLLMFVRYKNLKKTVLTLSPAVLAAFFILGFWSLCGAAISFLHLVGFLLAVSVCVDYGIFYQENRSGDIAVTYQAMAASMLTSVLAFGSLGAANTASLRILAGVVALGIFLGFLLCPLMIRQPPATPDP